MQVYILNHLQVLTKEEESKMLFQKFYMNDFRGIGSD